MAGLGCRPGEVIVSSSSTRSRKSRLVHADSFGKYAKKRTHLRLDLLSNPSNWWDNRREKRRSRHSNFRHKTTREPLCVDNQCKTSWANSNLATLTVQRPCGLKERKGGCHGVDEIVQSLCKEGQLDRALAILDQQDRLSVQTYRGLLKLCTKTKALAQAKRVHAHLARHGLEAAGYLGESLVNALVKCGSLEDALRVFEKSQHRTVISWTAVISGYSKAGQGQKALSTYQLMRKDGVKPDNYTFVSLLQACGSIADLEQGKHIHSEAVGYGFGSDLYVGTGLVDMYAKCGSIADAQSTFERLSQRDVVTWNALLAGYAQQGQVKKVFQLYEHMQEEGVGADDRTFVSLLQACGNLGDEEHSISPNGYPHNLDILQKGKFVHAESWRMGYGSHTFVGNALISMYGKCASMLDAWNVFDGLSQRDVVSWTAILTSHVQQGHPDKALQLYVQMQEAGFSPNDRTFVSILQACGDLADMEECVSFDVRMIRRWSLQKGKNVHADALIRGHQSDIFVANSLISMYGKCGCWVDARYVFDGLSRRNVVSWNAMLMAYVQHSQVEKVLQVYGQMWDEGPSPNDWTFVIALQACGLLAEEEDGIYKDGQCVKVDSLQKTKAIHAQLLQQTSKPDNFVGSTLISVYGKCGTIMEALKVFGSLTWCVVSCNAMLTVYAQQGHPEKALQLYGEMQKSGVIPNETTVVCTLQACSNAGALDICVQIHQDIFSTNNVVSSLVASTLVHAYGNCARMKDAQQLFDALSRPDVVSWTVLIAGYARQGCWEKSLECFKTMQLRGVKPDGVSFLSLLAACSHAGLVEKGIAIFESMSRDHGIMPRIEHYGIVVDLLGRAGYFTMVEDLLSSMPMEPDLSMWLCLLGACQKHGHVVLGKRAFDHTVLLQPKHSAAYVLMSNIYAHAGMWECATKVDELRQKAGASNNPAQSWIEHELEVHMFVVGDRQHPQQEPIHELMGTVIDR